MYLVLISLHSDENVLKKVNTVIDAPFGLRNSGLSLWNIGVKKVNSIELRAEPLSNRGALDGQAVIPKLKGLRYLLVDNTINDLEKSLKQYYETFLQIGYIVQVNVYNLETEILLEDFYATEFNNVKKLDIFSQYLDEQLDSFFYECSMTKEEYTSYLNYVENKVKYLNSEKRYKKNLDSNNIEPYILEKPSNKNTFNIYYNLSYEQIKDVQTYLLRFNQQVFVKKCDFILLDKIWLPEVKDIKPVNIDFTLGLRLSDINTLLETTNKVEEILEKQEEKQEEKQIKQEEVVEEETIFANDPYRIRDDITEVTKFSYDIDSIKNIKDTDIIITTFLDYFTNSLVVSTERPDFHTLPTKYVEDEFCYFIYDPIKYLTTLIMKTDNKELKNLLDNLNCISKEPITLNLLMKKCKDKFSSWYNNQSSKNLSLICCDDYRIILYRMIQKYNGSTDLSGCIITNIRKTIYELSIHTDIERKFWDFTETIADKTVNDIIIHNLVALFSKDCIRSSKEANILSSNIYKEFLGYLKFNKLSYYIPLISNISFTIHMKKLGYKTKRTSAGNAYTAIEMKESFTQDWVNNFIIEDTKNNIVESYDQSILIKNTRTLRWKVVTNYDTEPFSSSLNISS